MLCKNLLVNGIVRVAHHKEPDKNLTHYPKLHEHSSKGENIPILVLPYAIVHLQGK
jgi:hypothetical protein